MAYWTAGAEEKMMSQGKEGLQIFYRECCDLFNDIVDLVRGDIPELVRCTLKALIVLDVHARDMVKEFVDEGIEDK